MNVKKELPSDQTVRDAANKRDVDTKKEKVSLFKDEVALGSVALFRRPKFPTLRLLSLNVGCYLRQLVQIPLYILVTYRVSTEWTDVIKG